MRIVWTDKFKADYVKNLIWLEEEFGTSQVVAFDDEVDAFIKSIAEHPFSNPIFDKDEFVRRCVVHPKVTVI